MSTTFATAEIIAESTSVAAEIEALDERAHIEALLAEVFA